MGSGMDYINSLRDELTLDDEPVASKTPFMQVIEEIKAENGNRKATTQELEPSERTLSAMAIYSAIGGAS